MTEGEYGGWNRDNAILALNGFMVTHAITSGYGMPRSAVDELSNGLFEAKFTIFVPALKRDVVGSGQGESIVSAKQACALSIVQQLYEARLLPHFEGTSSTHRNTLRSCREKSGGGWHLANCFDGLHELLASKGLAQPNFKAKHMGNTTYVNVEIALPGLDKPIRCEGSGTSENRARAECAMALVRKLFDANIHTMKRLDIGPGMISFYRKFLKQHDTTCHLWVEVCGAAGWIAQDAPVYYNVKTFVITGVAPADMVNSQNISVITQLQLAQLMDYLVQPSKSFICDRKCYRLFIAGPFHIHNYGYRDLEALLAVLAKQQEPNATEDEIRLVIRRPQYIRPKNWCIFGQFRIVYFIGQNTDLNNRLVDYFSRQGTFTFEKKVNEAGKTKSKLRFWCTKLEQLTTYQDATAILANLNLMPAGAADSSKQTESTMAETDPDLEGSENMSDIPVSDENEDDKDEHEKPSPSMINDEPVQAASEVEKVSMPKLDAKMRKDTASEILVEPETQKHHHRRREDRKQKPALNLNCQTEQQNSQTKIKRAEKRAATTNAINDESEGTANDGAKARLTDLDPIEAYVTNYVRKLEKDANWAAHALKDIFPDIVGFLRTNMQQWIIGGKVPATTVSDEKDIKGVPIISVNNHWMVLHDDLNEWFLYKCNYADAKLRSYLSIQTLGIDICATYIRQQIEAKKVKEENADAKTTAAVEARPTKRIKMKEEKAETIEALPPRPMKRIKKEPIEAADR